MTERLERTAHGYERFRCRACGKQVGGREWDAKLTPALAEGRCCCLYRAMKAARALFRSGVTGITPDRVTTATLARSGNPNNPALPDWPRYDAAARSTMMPTLDSTVASNPGGAARAALDGLPPYEYSMPVNYPRP